MIPFRPVILCGGSGKRLWPVSRHSYPKQFTKLVSEDETLLQATLRRQISAGGARPLLLANNDHRFIVAEQITQIAIAHSQILIEPQGRNTAAAVCAAALENAKDDPEALMLVAPSDHSIHDEAAFSRAVQDAMLAAKDGHIVTFGIVPDRAETGYGYIEMREPTPKSGAAMDFVRFVEKPDFEEAKAMVESQKYLWNSGMFVMSAQTAIDAFKLHAADIFQAVSAAVDTQTEDLDFIRLGKEFSEARDISFDHAIMEYVEGKVVPLDGWNDLGSWATIHLEAEKDNDGNSYKGSVTTIDCHDSMIRSECSKIHVLGIGLDSLAVVAMQDAVLVADMKDSQHVSDAVKLMKSAQLCQASTLCRDYRPWGWFETLTKRQRFRVKSIVVKPGQKLSLQSHVHRSEHWIVVEGTAKVTIDATEKIVTENQSVFIPLGAVHRLENPGFVDLHLIEVQAGAYLEEDDIIRYDDVYDRR